MIAQGARSTKVKSALPKVREIKDVMDQDLKEQRTLMNLHFGNREFFAPKEAILAERELQKATIELIGYVDPDSKDKNSPSETHNADDETVEEGSSEARELSVNAEKDQGKRTNNAVEKMDQRLKLLKSLNDTFSRDESSKYEKGSAKYEAPAAEYQELKPSTSNFPSSMKSAPVSLRSINIPTPVLDLHDSVNDVDLRVEQNFWNKSHKWQESQSWLIYGIRPH